MIQHKNQIPMDIIGNNLTTQPMFHRCKLLNHPKHTNPAHQINGCCNICCIYADPPVCNLIEASSMYTHPSFSLSMEVVV
uniref:Cyc3 n=1 Tax=Arundo donax TaxID=35708 RepID=A0A0A9DSL2_ARUDO